MPEYELAEAIGVSRFTVAKWLNGQNAMTVEHLARIATVLGMRPAELLAKAESALLAKAFLPVR